MELVTSSGVREKLKATIRQFDLCALLKVLKTLGYEREDLYFVSNNIQVSHASLCEEIHFSTEGQVTIVLNMGLLSASGSLPSYIQQFLDTEEISADLFTRYINFFNHHLIDVFLQMTMPDLNDDFFLDWKETQLHYLSLLGFESISSLWFLIRICFPDLVIEVSKNPQMLNLHTSSLVFGRDTLGPNSFIGDKYKQMLSSYKVTITTDDEISELGTPWPIEIQKRLKELLFPVLRKTDLHLSMVLKINNNSNYLTLGPKSFLGYERLWKSSHPLQLLIFYGHIKNLQGP
jgi:hypothetical protein